MTNEIYLGDEVFIPGMPPIIGTVIEIDDHPLEYAMLKISGMGAAGEFHVWASCRMARKVAA